MNDSLGDRMKEYEAVTKGRLVRRMPAIIRLDGRAFHTLTRGMTRPFDSMFTALMTDTTNHVFRQIQTAVFAYVQSDEISILLKDYSEIETQPWFGGQIQKMVSTSAAICSVYFYQSLSTFFPDRISLMPTFDSRVFNIPKEDVVNYFIWRQKDATRNSINAVGQAHFSQKELQGKSQNNVLDMLVAKGINWNEVPTRDKRGAAIYRESKVFAGEPIGDAVKIDLEIPIFTENREFISRFL